MLQHHEPEIEEALAARVTSEELGRALAAIETRRQAELERDMDTIALGEAISQLGLTVTPQELLGEIRQQRDAALLRDQARSAERKRVQTRRAGTARRLDRAVSMASVPVLAMLLFGAILCELGLKSIDTISNSVPFPGVLVQWLLQPGMLGLAFYTAAVTWLSSPHGRRSLFGHFMTAADALRSGRPAQVPLSAVMAIACRSAPSTVLIDNNEPRHWQIADQDGEPVAHAWSSGQSREGVIRVYAARRAETDQGAAPIHPIAIPLHRFVEAREVESAQGTFNGDAVDIPV
jgi:hypothetical protein